MTTEIVKVNPSEYGIEESKANEIVGNFPQIISEREVLATQFDEVVKMDIESPQTAKRAKELRGLIKNNRTKGIEVWHKTTKDYFLKGGQFVDAIKRKEIAVNERMEEALEEIENYAAKKEAERKESLRVSRVEELQPYAEFVPMGVSLGELTEEEYLKVFNGAKLQTEAKLEAERKAEQERIEAERKAEEERIAKEKADTEAREQQRLENEKLKFEAEKREKEIETERKANEQKLAKAKAEADRIEVENKAKLKAEQDARAKIEAELQAKKDAEIKTENERKQAELKAKAEADRIEVENKAKLKAEQDARAKIEAELQAKKDAEIKTENERKQAELKAKAEAEKNAKAPIKKQLSIWVDSFSLAQINVNNEKTILIKEKFEAFKKWAKTEIESI